jgi:hypothetical protein
MKRQELDSMKKPEEKHKKSLRPKDTKLLKPEKTT